MDFIERFFDISPDGGDGTTEILLVAAMVAALIVVGIRKYLRNLNDRARSCSCS
jgi:hypothetical protein